MKEISKNPCPECPWKNNNSHSIKFRTYVEKMRSLGKIKHSKCHMKSKDIWGYQSEINTENVCNGSINFDNKK